MSPVERVTERDPLLQLANEQQSSSNDQLKGDNRHGPLDISRTTRCGILAGVWLGTFLTALNQTLVPTMLTSISSEFEKSHQASWLGTSYLLATCTFTPLYGRLCDALGRRGANHIALFFAASGILLCGFSTNLEMLIMSRFLCGIGGGGLLTTSSIVVSDMFSLQQGLSSRGCKRIQRHWSGVRRTFWWFNQFGWRWAFLIQMPLFCLSFVLTTYHLQYVTPGASKNAREVLKRIDYGGSITLLVAVGATLVFLSARYNEGLPLSHTVVVVSLAIAWIFFALFLLFEFFIATEPVLAPFLLKQKVPVLVGTSNFLVSTCNFAITYFYPMWFQTVALTSASVAGLHLLPNSVAVSIGSMFAGWMIHYTGDYKVIDLIFGVFPFIGATLITGISESSGFVQSWLSIIPLGFGNAVVSQTMLIALLAHLPESHVATGTGFGQLFKGLGQVAGVAVASAIFQSKLDGELRAHINGPGAEELISRIRQSARLVVNLPPPLQQITRDAYDTSLKLVFTFAASSTLMAYIIRIPVPRKYLEKQ